MKKRPVRFCKKHWNTIFPALFSEMDKCEECRKLSEEVEENVRRD